jgi:hypothetical protein
VADLRPLCGGGRVRVGAVSRRRASRTALTEALTTQDHQAAGRADQAPTMAPPIGAWRTEGEVFGADGRTVVATVAESDVYEELGPAAVPPR